MKLNRRAILASLGVMGGSATIAGAGTRALFSDTERVTTTATAGEIDLQLDWKAYHNGTRIAAIEPTDTDGVVAAQFDDLMPGDTGCFSLSLHNETNPAWVWLAVDIESETDGGDDSTGETDCPEVTYPLVCGRDTTDGNVTVSTDDSTLVVEYNAPAGESFTESHLGIEDAYDDFQKNVAPGQLTYSDGDATTVEAGYIRYEIPFGEAEIECGDEIVIAAHASSDSGETCWAGSTELPGKNWALGMTHEVCCGDSSGVEAGQLADNIYVDVFWDDDQDCEIDQGETVEFSNITLRSLTENIGKETGGMMPAWYSQGTQYLSITWDIPLSVGNEIQGDSLELSFTVYAEQRRHNDNPSSPWPTS